MVQILEIHPQIKAIVETRGSDQMWIVYGEYERGDIGEPLRYGRTGIASWGQPPTDSRFEITKITFEMTNPVVVDKIVVDEGSESPHDYCDLLPQKMLDQIAAEILNALENTDER